MITRLKLYNTGYQASKPPTIAADIYVETLMRSEYTASKNANNKMTILFLHTIQNTKPDRNQGIVHSPKFLAMDPFYYDLPR